MRRYRQLLVTVVLLSIFGGGCCMFVERDGYFASTRYNCKYLYLTSPIATEMVLGGAEVMQPLLYPFIPVGFVWWVGAEFAPGLAWDVIAVPWDTGKLLWK